MNRESVRKRDYWIWTIPNGNTSLDLEDLFLSFLLLVFLSFLSSLLSSFSPIANLWIGVAELSRPGFLFALVYFGFFEYNVWLSCYILSQGRASAQDWCPSVWFETGGRGHSAHVVVLCVR